MSDRIIEQAPYGQHIALCCKNHPEVRWSTKNIAPIGCRTIFYESEMGNGCPCPLSDLRPVHVDGPEVPE